MSLCGGWRGDPVPLTRLRRVLVNGSPHPSAPRALMESRRLGGAGVGAIVSRLRRKETTSGLQRGGRAGMGCRGGARAGGGALIRADGARPGGKGGIPPKPDGPLRRMRGAAYGARPRGRRRHPVPERPDAPVPPRSSIAPAAEQTDAGKAGPRRGRARRQSFDWLAARTRAERPFPRGRTVGAMSGARRWDALVTGHE